MTIRDKVSQILNKEFSDYNLSDVVELSKLKLKVWEMASEAKAIASQLEQQYKSERSKLYLENRLNKKTDKQSTEEALIATEKLRTSCEKTKSEADTYIRYHKDLWDILVAIRMCTRVYDEAFIDKAE